MIGRSIVALVLVLLVTACGPSGPSSVALGDVASASPATAATPAPTPTATPAPTPTPAPTASPSPTATPSPTPAPTPTPWKSYRSKRYHYRMKYPPLWVVTPGTTRTADQFDDFSTRFIYVDRDTVSGVVSLSLTVTHQIAWYKSHYRAKLLSRSSLTVAGWPARMLTFRASRDGRTYYVQQLMLGKGKVGYFLTWWSDFGDTAADKATFRSIYRTFRPTP